MNLDIKTVDQFTNTLISRLQRVIDNLDSYTELQKLVDEAVIHDQLPDDLPKEVLNIVFSLQTDLELIAEHQSSYLGSNAAYTEDEVAQKLKAYYLSLNKEKTEKKR